ncbi:MAG: 2Fe-2S iron-sulfur cluster-binding protein [Gloeotrichia echinulata GP01]
MTKTYTVEIHHQGSIHTLQVPEDQTILSVADKAELGLPSSCHAGVCTTCAGKIIEGMVNQADGMGVSPHLQKQGYVLLCVAKPLSDIKVETEKEDTLYQLQFGKDK